MAVIALTVWSYRYFGRYSPFAAFMNEDSSTLSQIGLTIDDATVSIRSGGHRRLRVEARNVTYSRDHSVIILNGLHDGVLFDGDGKPQAHFDAGHMEYDTPSGQISTVQGAYVRLTGGIHAVSVKPDSPTISTASFDWNATRKRLHAPGDVDLIFPHNSGAATATDVTLDTQTLDLFAKRVHGTFRPSKLVQ